MLWSGSSPMTVVRDGMWGFLLVSGVAWLAIAWSVLRLEPATIAEVAGPVVLFAALTEAVRALAGTRTWWLNAGMTVLFAATGALLLADGSSSWTSPAALIGWYLMVRGAADLAIALLTRETDRIWGLLTVVGVAEAALGFFAASAFVRTAEAVVIVLGGAALLRGVADLVAALRLREASALTRAQRLLELPPERAIGVAGYTAGLADFEEAPARGTGPRHRAATPLRSSAAGMADLSRPTSLPGTPGAGFERPHAAMGNAGAFGAAQAMGNAGSWDASGAAGAPGNSGPWMTGAVTPAAQTGIGPAGHAGIGPALAAGTGFPDAEGSFHDEVLRTTADLDTMLALAGVTGSGMPGASAQAAAEVAGAVTIPDTAEGAELPDPGQVAAAEAAALAAAVASANASAAAGHQRADDPSLPLLDPAARASETASPSMDDTSIIMRGRHLQ